MRPYASALMGWGARIRAGAFAALALFSAASQAQTNCPVGQASLQYIVSVGSGFGAPVPSSMSGSTHRDYASPVAGCVAYRNYLLTLPSGSSGRLAAEQRPYCLTSSTTSANMCFNTTGTGCGSTFNVQMSNSACSTCPAGKTAVDGVCITPTSACPASGTVMTTGRLTTRGAALGANQCFNGCKVTRSTGDASQFSVAFPDAPTVDPVVVSGGSATTWTATGDTCTGEKVVSSEAAYSASGANYAKVEPDGCGTVNGARFCASDLPTATNCATGSDGSRVCGSTASTPPVPIKPGTGTGAVLPSPGNPSGTPAVPAQPADPNATIGTTDAAGNTTTHNYYNTTTVNNQGGDGTGSTGGTQSGNGFATCGGPGQPACAVDLDETGTPTDQSLAEAIGYDHEARGTELNELATTSPLNGINTAGVTNAVALPSGTCTSISPSFTWRGNTYAYAFPGTKGCVMIEMIKTVLDWLIGSITVLWCVRRFMEG